MGKKKAKSEYNDYLDGEKLRDNTEIRTSLLGTSARALSPPPTRQAGKGKEKETIAQPGGKKPQLTHFLCLPLVNPESKPQLEQSLGAFTKELGQQRVVPLKAVRPVDTLHLTLGVMALDEAGTEGVGRCLEELDLGALLRNSTCSSTEDVHKGEGAREGGASVSEPLSISLKGLVPMQPQQRISVLYAEPVDDTERLYAFSSAVRDHFVHRGFLVPDERPLKLHATIVNTIYAKAKGRPAWKNPDPPTTRTNDGGAFFQPPEGRPGNSPLAHDSQDRPQGYRSNAKSIIRFDARELIAQYEGFVWAEDVVIDRLQVCKMGARKVLDGDGEVVGEEYEEVFGRRI